MCGGKPLGGPGKAATPLPSGSCQACGEDLFITVLAYQLVQAIRHKLKAAGEHASWASLREILSVQQRVTVTFRQRDGRTLHVRKAAAAEPALRKIYDALDRKSVV